MLNTIYDNPWIFQTYFGYDKDDEQSFDEAMTEFETMRLVCTQTRDIIDNHSFWQLFAQKCNISLPIKTRRDLHELVVKKMIPKQKIFPFIGNFSKISIKIPPTLRLIRELNRQFISKECAEKSNLQVLWANLQLQHKIKDINLIRKHTEEEIRDPSITSEQKTKEFKEWLDKHPEIYNIEELKINKYMNNLTIIPREIQYLPNLKVLDFTNCRFLVTNSIADINLKEIHTISVACNRAVAELVCLGLRNKCFQEGIEKIINYQCDDDGKATIYIQPPVYIEPPVTTIPPELQLLDDEASKENSVLGKHYIEDWSDDFSAKKHHPSDNDFQFDWNGDIW